MSDNITIHWFRQDLRLADNPALLAAVNRGQIIPVYILDDINSGEYKLGEASRCWLHHSLVALNTSLDGKLLVYSGDPEVILNDLVATYNATAIYWNRCYESWSIARDSKIKQNLSDVGLEITSFNGSLLWEPWEVLKSDGTPYRVFTPFYNNGYTKDKEPRLPTTKPQDIRYVPDIPQDSLSSINNLNLLPSNNWGEHILASWDIGEISAQNKLQDFIYNQISLYKLGRDFPAKGTTSRLAPYLHFGELSPNQVWYASYDIVDNENLSAFRRQLVWREFSYTLLYYNPQLPSVNLHSKFDKFPWLNDPVKLLAWQTGQTGIPIVDAGMRELWQTGYMHNRVRMIVGSFLIKNLLIDWRCGESWFWECLLDANLANNSVSWQWVAGSGADAAPYYRIFNPVTQGQKFDATGEYTRRYIPELSAIPDKFLFNPWEAPQSILDIAGVELGVTYPKPIADLKLSREVALAAFKLL